MYPSATVLLLLFPIVLAQKRCYSFNNSTMSQQNNMMPNNNMGINNNMGTTPRPMGNNMMQTEVQCPLDTQFCYKIDRQVSMNGQTTWVMSKGCATSDVCEKEQCTGKNDNRVCCCKNELCNGADSKFVFMSSLAAIFMFFLPIFH